jgi:hypothetical protein
MMDFHIEEVQVTDERFQGLPEKIYPVNSPRFKLGFDPQVDFLVASFILLNKDEVVGRYAIYENAEIRYLDHKTATIGSYECKNDRVSTHYLLEHARHFAKSRGNTFLIGPMEGSTWNNYRFSASNEHPNFFMEPFHHIDYNTHFRQNGFQSIGTYISNLDADLKYNSLVNEEIEEKLSSGGYTMRHIDFNELEKDLLALAKFSNENFSDNFLFSHMDEVSFVKKYTQISSLFKKEFIFLIENREGKLEAFCFSIPDYTDALNETLIIKTVARKKDSKIKRLGFYLLSKTYEQAIKLGYTKAIHAFMAQENNSISHSEKLNGKTYKTYHLYGLEV